MILLAILICSLCGLATVAIWGACWLNADRDRRSREDFNIWLESKTVEQHWN